MSLINLKIDGTPVSVPAGTTILSAARLLNIPIPTLCHVEGLAPSSSCFLCAVQIEGRPNLWPSCSMPAGEGMYVITNSETVRTSRKTALELLISDHTGDCMGSPDEVDASKLTDEELAAIVQSGGEESSSGGAPSSADRKAKPGRVGKRRKA